MRHFLLLFIALLLGYGLWQLGGRTTLHRLARHALRIAAIALVLLAGLVLAFNSTSIKLL
jgi:hypothetical protein